MREFTFIGIALLRRDALRRLPQLTATVDHADGQPPERRLSLSGESVGLGVLFLCGLRRGAGRGRERPSGQRHRRPATPTPSARGSSATPRSFEIPARRR